MMIVVSENADRQSLTTTVCTISPSTSHTISFAFLIDILRGKKSFVGLRFFHAQQRGEIRRRRLCRFTIVLYLTPMIILSLFYVC